jgi:hypothetical protein
MYDYAVNGKHSETVQEGMDNIQHLGKDATAANL